MLVENSLEVVGKKQSTTLTEVKVVLETLGSKAYDALCWCERAESLPGSSS